MELILALIHQLNGAVFTLIVLLILTIVLTYKAGGIVTSFKGFQKKNETIDTKIDGIKDSLSKIQATTDLLYQAHLSTVQAHSPVSLTAKGKEISDAISAEIKINDHWDAIKAKIEAKNPTNPYDIQNVAMDIARDCFEKIFTPQEQNQIKTYAYGIGLNLLEIFPILGVIIRDRFLREHNLSVEDVDKHAPTAQ